jgi:2Fe-2S ferredoxin
MGVINVTDRNGQQHTLEAVEGWRVMELLREYKMDVTGICGGMCDCGSCHVVIADEWKGVLHPPREDEVLKLDELPNYEPNSRLSCQIIWDETLDGLTLRIADDCA